jgi:electron transfer flavoprotein alpha subunit
MGEARKLADKLGVSVAGVVMGGPDEKLDDFAKEAYAYGADSCYVMRDPVLKGYRNEPFTKGMTDLVNQYQPEILLLGATTMGRDLAGSVATTLGTGLTADCTELNIDGTTRALAATRPTFGGSLLCTIMTLAYRPQMATMRPRTAPMPRRDDSRTGSITEATLGMVETDIVTKLLDFIPDANRNTVNLAYADVIVSGGKGLKNRTTSSWCGTWPACWAPRWAPPARWCRPAGWRPSARSARPARRCGPSSTSPPASPAPSSTGWAWRART